MATKPKEIDLSCLKSASESSTPTEDYLTPPAEGFALNPNEAFSFVVTSSQNSFVTNNFRNMNTIASENNFKQKLEANNNFEKSSIRKTFKISNNTSSNETFPIKNTAPDLRRSEIPKAYEQVSDTDLVNIRKRLEERRKRIETEKKLRQTNNKQLFNSLVTSKIQDNDKTPTSDANNNDVSIAYAPTATQNNIDFNNNPQRSGEHVVNNTLRNPKNSHRRLPRTSKSYYGQESFEVLGKLFTNDNNNNSITNSANHINTSYNSFEEPSRNISKSDVQNRVLVSQQNPNQLPLKQQISRPSSKLSQPLVNKQQTHKQLSPTKPTSKLQSPTKPTSKLQSPTKIQSLPKSTSKIKSPMKSYNVNKTSTSSKQTSPQISPNKTISPTKHSSAHQSALKQPTRSKQPLVQSLEKHQPPLQPIEKPPYQPVFQEKLPQHLVSERRKWVKPMYLNTVDRNSSTNKSQLNSHNQYSTSIERLNHSLTELQSEIMQLSLEQKSDSSPVLDNENVTDHLTDVPNEDFSPFLNEEIEDAFENPSDYNNTDPQENLFEGDFEENEVIEENEKVYEKEMLESASYTCNEDPNDEKAEEKSAFQRYNMHGRAQKIQQQQQPKTHDVYANRSFNGDNERFMTPPQAFYDYQAPRPDMPMYHPHMVPSQPYHYYPFYTPPGYYPHYPYPPYNPYMPQPPMQQQPPMQPPYPSPFRSLDRRKDGHRIKRESSLGGFPKSPSKHYFYPADGLRSRRESLSASRNFPPQRTLARPSSVISDYFHSTEQDYNPALKKHNTSSSYPPLAFSNEFNTPHRQRHLFSSRNSLSSPGYYSPHQQQQIYQNLEATNNLASSFYGDNNNSTTNSPQQNKPTKTCPQSEFFVVNLDTPKRPKPQISSHSKSFGRNRKLSNSQSSDTKSDKVSSATSSSNNNEKSGEVKKEGGTPSNKTDEDASESGSIGFVIDDDAITDPVLQAEAEKKKQKLKELHEKRKKQVEDKKKIRSDKEQQKMQQKLLKEEESKQKKTEEKQRREAIFKQYLQRKAAEQSDGSLPEDANQDKTTPTKSAKSTTKGAKPASARVKGKQSARPSSQLLMPVNNEVSKALTADVDSSDYKKGEKLMRFLSYGSEAGSDEPYSGPKLFVKPNQKSNRNIIMNALKDCCLAGTVNKELKTKVLEEIGKSDSKHFVVLFRDAGLQFRAVYSYNPDKNEVIKVHGVGPKQLLDSTMEKFFKYDSGCKNFSEVTSTKHLSSTIDGVTIPSCMWIKKVPTATVAPYNGNKK